MPRLPLSPYHPLLRCGLFVVFYLGSLLLGVTLAQLILQPFHLPAQDFSLLATVLGGLLGVATATGLMLALYERQSFGFVGLSLDPACGPQLGGGFLLGFAMAGTVAAIAAACGQVRIQANSDFQTSRLAYAVVVLLLGAAGEEMLFRGYGFQRLVAAAGPALSIGGASLLFGLLHRSNPAVTRLGVVNTILVGVLLALAYLRTRRLWLPIGLHWGWNLAGAALGFPVSGIRIEGMPLVAGPLGHPLITGGAYGPEASVLATLVILAGTAGLLMLNKPTAGSRNA